MKKKLLIVESPAKIKTISKFLGKDFVILSTMGHIKDLPQKKLGVTIEGTDKKGSIELEYVVIEKKDKLIADICRQARGADEIFLAPDPDREGEIIAWHVEQEILRCAAKKADVIRRISFNEITKSAITQALEHPYEVDLNMVSAQQARRVLDRWVGYQVSPILWRKVSKGLSAGRVQSVALKLICEREDAIRIFKPEEYWSIEALFGFDGTKIPAALAQIDGKKAEVGNEADAKAIVERTKKSSFVIGSVKDSKRTKNPLAPFITSTLQQSAYNQLGFSVDKTMQLAQKLYEGVPLEDKATPVALITYMRTDSVRIADSALQDTRKFIKHQFGDAYVPTHANTYTKKAAAQDAHEAIRPVDIAIAPEQVSKYLEPAMAKLYALIWKRFVACQMTPAEYAQRQVTLEGNGLVFKATGSTLLFDGFLKVYSEPDEEEEGKVVLPQHLVEKQPVAVSAVTPKQHFTQPPPRFTQASLVKELEKNGVGRPSTYAAILKTIQMRAYTHLDEKKRFVPSELGMTVTKLLSENVPDIMDIKFTAHMEEDLDKVAQGELERDKLLRAFYKPFSKSLEAFGGEAVKREVTDIVCPECKKGKLLIRFGKAGSFLGCEHYPECKFTTNFERDEQGVIKLVEAQKPQLLAEKCPQCGKPLRQMMGRFGPFIACSGYPECKYIYQHKASFPCPQSGGTLTRRSWKGKVFWGCSDYPKCKFTISGDIEEKECPKCKSPYLLKRIDAQGKVLLTCPNKSCDYREE